MAKSVGGFSFTLIGEERVLSTLRRMQAQFGDKVGGALKEQAELIMTDSKQNFVPVDTSALKTSGNVGHVKREGRDLSVELTYGGPSVDYAQDQHETHRTKSKYLERPLNNAIPGFLKNMKKSMGAL